MRMGERVRLAVVLLAIVMLAGCGTPVRTFSEADTATDFGKIRT